MTMHSFEQQMAILQQAIHPGDTVSALVVAVMNTIQEGFNTFHTQVSDINARHGPEDTNQKMGDLDKAARQIDITSQQAATQVAQGLGHHQSVDKHNKGNPRVQRDSNHDASDRR